MKILAVGGGSGGHVTPVVAVLREVRKKHPRAELRFWCDYKFLRQSREIVHGFDPKIPVQWILAGKLRRYSHMTTLQHLMTPSIVLKNIRDAFLVVAGLIQSIIKLLIWRPDVIFLKGGYVSLPVGIAAHIWGIPFVIHDSDSYPGLTNRILSRWASSIATGAPLENYPYDKTKTKYVGIPVAPEFHEYSDADKLTARRKWWINPDRPLLVVTGGGLGAKNINDVTITTLHDLLKISSVVLISGVGQYDELRSLTPPNDQNFQLHPFISKDLASLLGAADVVVSRAGATFILELAALAKPTILIPNAKLTAGHQVKNAKVYEDTGALVVLDEDKLIKHPNMLVDTVKDLMDDTKKARSLGQKFAEYAKPNAASDVADMVLSLIK